MEDGMKAWSDLPWSLKTNVTLVLDFDPMVARIVFTVKTEVSNELKLDCIVLRSLDTEHKIT